jgi:hypothetical protein
MSANSLIWRKSSHSTDTGTCVEIARHPGGRVLVRNSNAPDAGTLAFTRDEMSEWIHGCRVGDFDDLAG